MSQRRKKKKGEEVEKQKKKTKKEEKEMDKLLHSVRLTNIFLSFFLKEKFA